VKERRICHRATSVVLLLALLPSVLYLGHWSLRVPIPTTGAFVAIGMRAEHDAQAARGDDHGKHCHGDATCTDAPPAPAINVFAMLSESILLLGSAGLLILAATLAWRPARGWTVVPLARPPRLSPPLA
jgi:hypothetical protein